MKLITAIAALLLAVTVQSLPSTEVVNAELPGSHVGYPIQDESTPFVQYDAHADAKATVDSLLQQGKDMGACATLASTTIKEVEDSVGAQQSILNALDNGDKCPAKGQAGVDAANKALNDAKEDKADADKAYAAAKSAPVAFGPKAFNTMNENSCSIFTNDPAYVAAKGAESRAKKSAEQAAGAITAAQTALDAAKEAQDEARKECYCTVRANYNKAWSAATANNEEDKKAYTKGKHMKCVLDGVAPNSCNVGTIPEVKAVNLAEGVPANVCVVPTPTPTPVPTPVPTPDPTPAPAPPQGDWTNANQCNKDSKGCCKGWPSHDNRFCHTNRKDSRELNMADCMAKGIKEGGHSMIAFAGPVNGDGNKHRCDWWPSAPVGAFNEAVSKGTCCHSWTICPINQ